MITHEEAAKQMRMQSGPLGESQLIRRELLVNQLRTQVEEEHKTSRESGKFDEDSIEGQAELMVYISEMIVLITTGDDEKDSENIEMLADNIHQKAT